MIWNAKSCSSGSQPPHPATASPSEFKRQTKQKCPGPSCKACLTRRTSLAEQRSTQRVVKSRATTEDSFWKGRTQTVRRPQSHSKKLGLQAGREGEPSVPWVRDVTGGDCTGEHPGRTVPAELQASPIWQQTQGPHCWRTGPQREYGNRIPGPKAKKPLSYMKQTDFLNGEKRKNNLFEFLPSNRDRGCGEGAVRCCVLSLCPSHNASGHRKGTWAARLWCKSCPPGAEGGPSCTWEHKQHRGPPAGVRSVHFQADRKGGTKCTRDGHLCGTPPVRKTLSYQ